MNSMQAKFWLLSLLSLGHLGYARPSQRAVSQGPLVQDLTSDVKYQGTTSSRGVESFLNIKFGQDTSGENRFAAPRPFSYANGTTVDASKAGAACPQQKEPLPGFNVFSNVTDISEDCLTLRVDRAANTTADAKLPVLLWIYGGGDTIGQIYDEAYNPTGLILGSLAKEKPIIYAAVNYRVGFFGWSAFNGTTGTAVPNAGLYDQRLGMEWIQEHIASFGGDPDNITIFGESEGATAIGLQITAYGGDRPAPFKRAIMESGAPTAEGNIVGNKTWINTQQLAAKLNCSASSNDVIIECLRKLSLNESLPTIIDYELTLNPFGGLEVFNAVVDGAFVPAAPSELLHSGRFSANTPVIVGWNENDGALFVSKPAQYANESYLSSWLMSKFDAIDESQVQAALALYPNSSFAAQQEAFPKIPLDWWRASQIERDAEFACPALYMTQMAAKHSNESSYLFALNATLFTRFLASENASFEGVVHFSDIPYVFNQATAYNASQDDISLASRTSGSWVEFAYSGQPTATNGDVNATLANWPVAVDQDGKDRNHTIRVIGGPQAGVVHTGLQLHGNDFEELGRRCAFWNSPEILKAMGV